MQRIISIKIGGIVVPIEEDAFLSIRDYIASLKRQFTQEDGKEIINDIEHRIAELFNIRLQHGAAAIDSIDVRKVIETLGTPGAINEDLGNSKYASNAHYNFDQSNSKQYHIKSRKTPVRLLRDPFNKVFGGVCSGIAHYFDIDPIIIRLVWVVLFLTAGIGLIAYIIAWLVIPVAKTQDEFNNMTNGNPITFHDISHNVTEELHDLKKRGEQMSKDLKDFFSKSK